MTGMSDAAEEISVRGAPSHGEVPVAEQPVGRLSSQPSLGLICAFSDIYVHIWCTQERYAKRFD